MRILVSAAMLAGAVLLATILRGGSQISTTLPLTRREYEDRLANFLEQALSYRNRQMWDEVSEECRRIGREDLPGHVRKKYPELADWL